MKRLFKLLIVAFLALQSANLMSLTDPEWNLFVDLYISYVHNKVIDEAGKQKLFKYIDSISAGLKTAPAFVGQKPGVARADVIQALKARGLIEKNESFDKAFARWAKTIATIEKPTVEPSAWDKYTPTKRQLAIAAGLGAAGLAAYQKREALKPYVEPYLRTAQEKLSPYLASGLESGSKLGQAGREWLSSQTAGLGSKATGLGQAGREWLSSQTAGLGSRATGLGQTGRDWLSSQTANTGTKLSGWGSALSGWGSKLAAGLGLDKAYEYLSKPSENLPAGYDMTSTFVNPKYIDPQTTLESVVNTPAMETVAEQVVDLDKVVPAYVPAEEIIVPEYDPYSYGSYGKLF